jgi:hypothetical protein
MVGFALVHHHFTFSQEFWPRTEADSSEALLPVCSTSGSCNSSAVHSDGVLSNACLRPSHRAASEQGNARWRFCEFHRVSQNRVAFSIPPRHLSSCLGQILPLRSLPVT